MEVELTVSVLRNFNKRNNLDGSNAWKKAKRGSIICHTCKCNGNVVTAIGREQTWKITYNALLLSSQRHQQSRADWLHAINVP